jgi:small subunit ribosomal protein S5|tara:strand:- start:830 stop:1732 length:903 start_codon:yes stop_codon:yes gene_type:complete
MSEEKKEVTNSPIKNSGSIKTDELKTSDQKSVSIEKIDEKKVSAKNTVDSSESTKQGGKDKLEKANAEKVKTTNTVTSEKKNNTENKKTEKLSVKSTKPNDQKEKNTKHKDSNSNDSSENQNKLVDQNELVEKLVSINRVAKVVKGGRRFSFAALVVVGDGNGMVGHGKGKAKEVPEAIKKATDEAKNKMIRVPLRQGRTLHHDIRGRYDAGKVYLRSAPSGTGVIAGGPMRAVFEALGIQDIVAKSVGTSNPHNMIRATFEALKSASSPKIIAVRRGLKINDITKRRKGTQQGIENGKN